MLHCSKGCAGSLTPIHHYRQPGVPPMPTIFDTIANFQGFKSGFKLAAPPPRRLSYFR